MVEGNMGIDETGVAESKKKPVEPGVERNEQGRIVATGWPKTKKKEWLDAYKQIGKTVATQVKYEHIVKSMGKRTEQGYDVVKNLPFVLSRKDLSPYLRKEILLKSNKDRERKLLKICDIGGGTGDMLWKALYKIGEEAQNLELETTMTTLVHHDREETKRSTGIDKVRTLAVELPHDDMYEEYDIITCQNSVFNWSKFPELSTLNMWKMLREGGVIIGTAWKRAREIDGKNFDTITFLKNTELFDFEELGEANEGAAVAFKLTKKKLPAKTVINDTNLKIVRPKPAS